jgi:hypothetical protein
MSEQALARQELLQLDFTLVEQLAELLAEAQRSHYIRPTVDPQEAASMLFSLAMYDFILFLTDDLMPFAELEKTLNRHINIVFAGLSSQGGRNE